MESSKAPVPLELLPSVVAAVGERAEVYVCGDIAAAVGLGATGVMIGRAYLHGLMVGGQRGVTATLDILTADLRRAMCLLCTPSIADLTTAHVRLCDA